MNTLVDESTKKNHQATKTSSSSSIQPKSFEPTISSVWTARLLIVFAASLYGTNYSTIKILQESIPTEIGAALRFSVAALVTIPFLFQQKNVVVEEEQGQEQKEKNLINDNGAKGTSMPTTTTSSSSIMDTHGAFIGGAEVGFWNFLGYMMQVIALQTTPAGTNAFISSLAVVIVPLLDVVSGKQILPRQIIGAMVAVVGVGFLQLDGLVDHMASGEPLLSSGMGHSLVQPFMFGIAYWRMEYYTRRVDASAGFQLTFAQLVTIASLMIGNVLWTNGGWWGGLGMEEGRMIPEWSQVITWLSDPMIVGAILWTGVVTTTLGIFIETQALKTISAAETTMLYSTEPIFGSVIAAIVLGETLGVTGVFGGALILGGCLYSTMHLDENDMPSS